MTWHETIDVQKAHIANLSAALHPGQTTSADLTSARGDLSKMVAAERLEPSWERVTHAVQSPRPSSSRLPFALDARDDCVISPDKIVYMAHATNGIVETPLMHEAMKYVRTAWNGNQINVYGSDTFRKLSWAVAQVYDIKVANFRLKGQDDMPRVTQLKIAHGIITGIADRVRAFNPDPRQSPDRPGNDGLSSIVTRIYRL